MYPHIDPYDTRRQLCKLDPKTEDDIEALVLLDDSEYGWGYEFDADTDGISAVQIASMSL